MRLARERDRARHGGRGLGGAARGARSASRRASAVISTASFSAAARPRRPSVTHRPRAVLGRRARRARCWRNRSAAPASRQRRKAARLLLELRASALVRKLDEPGRRRLQALLPPLLADIGAADRGRRQLPVLRRMLAIHRGDRQALGVFRAAAREQPARARLVELCRHGDFLAARSPPTRCCSMSSSTSGCCRSCPTRADSRARARGAHAAAARGGPGAAGRGAAPFPARRRSFAIAVADLTGTAAAHAGERPAHRRSPSSSSSARCELGWRQITAQFGVPHCGEGVQRAARQHLRRRLRQARRHGARLLLGSRPRVSARLARRAPGDQRRHGRSTTSCSSCGWRSASCTC